MKRTGFMVMRINVAPTFEIPALRKSDVPLQWPEGMVGLLYVYATRADAEADANGAEVLEVAWDTNKPNRSAP